MDLNPSSTAWVAHSADRQIGSVKFTKVLDSMLLTEAKTQAEKIPFPRTVDLGFFPQKGLLIARWGPHDRYHDE